MVIPKALAFATIASLPLQVGLYTAIVPAAVYALLGTSRPLSVSTTTTIAILSAPILGPAAAAGPTALAATTATLTLLVGALLVLASLLRLGFVANFISEPVLVGFKSGIGLVIVADQLPKLLGLHVEKAGFFRDLLEVAGHAQATHLPSLCLALGTLGLFALLGRLAPRLPAPVVAVVVGSAIVALLPGGAGIATVDDVPRALPSLTLPALDQAGALWAGAAGIALMSFTESIAAARAFAAPDEPRPRPDRELLAIGAGNLAGALLGAMPSGGGTSQTAVNHRAGARSRAAGLVTAGVGLVTLVALAPLIGLLPQPVLAAVVVAYSVGLIDPKELREIARIRRTELAWAVIALVGVVLLGTLQGILVAVVASLLAIAYQTHDVSVSVLGRKRGTLDVFRPRSDEHPDDETFPGLLLLRPLGRIFFSNAARVGDLISPIIERERPRVIALDFSAVIDLEYTALRMLTAAEERLRREGRALWLVGLNPDVLAVVRRSRLGQALGDERMCFTLHDAVERFGRAAPPPTTDDPGRTA